MSKSVGAKPDFATGINANAVLTLAAGRARNLISGQIVWSYNGIPTTGRLTVLGGGFHVDFDITNGGPGFIPFMVPMHAMDDNPIIITLYAGGVAGMVGKLSLMGRGME